jgi:nitroreductase
MDILEAIHARRSIRKFKEDPIDREIVERLLDAAVQAPSAKNSQTWRFTVVMGSKKEEMLKVIRQGMANREVEGQELGTIRWSVQCIEQAPVTLLVHNTDGIHPWKPRKEHESWWDLATVQSVGAAIQTLLLAATDEGLGSLWIADIWEAYPEVNAWLDTDHQLVSAVALGYPDVSPETPQRKPLAEVVRWLE